MIARQLETIVNQRERAYTAAGMRDAVKLQAISTLKRILTFCKGKPEYQQLNMLRPYKGQMQAIMPGHRSRFQGIRNKLSTLIDIL
ncbi:MAG: hypothetical protein AAGF85_00500 [Bacteroidota bacterium]